MVIDSISAVLPAYNEEGNIQRAITQVRQVVAKLAKKWEIIVVDDGSTDRTESCFRTHFGSEPRIRLIRQRHSGYGATLKRGISAASGDWVFITDSDCQFDIRELKKFVQHTPHADLVIGYRKKRAEGTRRHIFALSLRVWNFLWFGMAINIKDVDCAFKLLKRSCLKEIWPHVADGAMVSTELLLRASRKKLRIVQLGVSHFPRLTGKATGSSFGVIRRAVTETIRLKKDLTQ